MKKLELNDLAFGDLNSFLKENLEALQNLHFQKAMQQLENPIQISHLRKDIAQIKTLLREYELGVRSVKSGEAK